MSRLFYSKETKCKGMELFIEALENKLFNPNNIQKLRKNLNKNEKLDLKEITSWDDKVIGVQDKGVHYLGLDYLVVYVF